MVLMNKEVKEFIKELKEKLNKKLENYELDKAFGQLSPESIYSLFPTESKMLLDYINQLETTISEVTFFTRDKYSRSFISEDLKNELLEILERGKEW